MPANTSPIFTLTPQVEWSTTMYGANTGNLSAGTTYMAFSAASNGSYVQKIRFKHQSSNVNSVATVARVFINNGASTGTAANNTIWDEVTIASNTAVQNAATITYELPLNFALPPFYTI